MKAYALLLPVLLWAAFLFIGTGTDSTSIETGSVVGTVTGTVRSLPVSWKRTISWNSPMPEPPARLHNRTDDFATSLS